MIIPIKWSGSKRSQAPEIAKYITKNYDTYYELFCGGCSMLFYLLENRYYADKFKSNRTKKEAIKECQLRTRKV